MVIMMLRHCKGGQKRPSVKKECKVFTLLLQGAKKYCNFASETSRRRAAGSSRGSFPRSRRFESCRRNSKFFHVLVKVNRLFTSGLL